MKQNVIIALLVAILALVGWSYIQPASEVFGGANCNSGNCTDYDAVNTIKGYWIADVATIDLNGNLPKTTIALGSTTIFTGRGTNSPASTTVCYQQFSTVATSTLQFAIADFTTGTTTNAIVTLAKSSGTSASTTPLQNFSLPANTRATLTSTTTLGATFAPGQYLIWTMAGGIGTFSPDVKCDSQAVISI